MDRPLDESLKRELRRMARALQIARSAGFSARTLEPFEAQFFATVTPELIQTILDRLEEAESSCQYLMRNRIPHPHPEHPEPPTIHVPF